MDRRVFVATAACTAIVATANAARAQTSGVSRIIYPFAAGGGGDTLCRLLAEHLRNSLNRNFIVENRTGADGLIGIRSVKGTAPDGTTILVTTGPTMYLLPMTERTPSFEPEKDFVPLSLIGRFEFAIVAGNTTGIRTVAELKAWVKANPGKASYGIPSNGTIPHFAGWQMEKLLDISMTKVAYRGGAPALNDIMGSHLPIAVVALADALNLHRAGNIRIISVLSAARSPYLPDVPTMKEGGVTLVADSWYGAWLPAGAQPGIRDALNAAIKEAMARPEVKERLNALGVIAIGSTVGAIEKELRDNTDAWRPIVAATGYKISP